MTPRLYLSVHATISSTFRRTYWRRFLQALLRYVLQHLILLLFFASCTDYYLQFKEVGSPAAGEAMEEQADTDRTETARANHS